MESKQELLQELLRRLVALAPTLPEDEFREALDALESLAQGIQNET